MKSDDDTTCSTCFYCDAPLTGDASFHEHDHFPIPQRYGGGKTVCACIPCHDQKDRNPDFNPWDAVLAWQTYGQLPPVWRMVFAKMLMLILDLARQNGTEEKLAEEYRLEESLRREAAERAADEGAWKTRQAAAAVEKRLARLRIECTDDLARKAGCRTTEEIDAWAAANQTAIDADVAAVDAHTEKFRAASRRSRERRRARASGVPS